MKSYTSRNGALEYIDQHADEVLDPQDDEQFAAFAESQGAFTPFDTIQCNSGVSLNETIQRRFGDAGLKILDIGCGPSLKGIYLWYQGHEVTVADTDTRSLEVQAFNAEALNVDPSEFAVRQQSILDDLGEDEYDIVVADILLHFLPETLASRALRNMRKATKIGGLNVLSAYSTDNPNEEKMPPRNLTRFYAGPQELGASHIERRWDIVEGAAGISAVPMERESGKYLVPSYVRAVLQKREDSLNDVQTNAAFIDFDNLSRGTTYSVQSSS